MTADGTTIELLRSWRAGDHDALDELIRRHLSWIADYVHGRLGQEVRRHGDTMDLVQEAMIDVMTYGPRFELADAEHFRRLLARIVENNIRDRLKWLRRERRNIAREREVTSDSILQLDPTVRAATSPPDAADRNERRGWVQLALELLDPQDRDVIRLREWEKLSFEEIGQRLDIRANAARMRFERALPKLACKIQALRSGQLPDELD